MNRLSDSFVARGKRLLNLQDYSEISSPEPLWTPAISCPHDRQYILRMMLRAPGMEEMAIPAELDWLLQTLTYLDRKQIFHGLLNPYVYVTVRHGLVTSETDDDWHVDGFSMRVPHTPEQNYFWTTNDATEYQNKAFPMPAGFDPLKHNIHAYLAANADDSATRQCAARQIYAFDPYFVHRRPKCSGGKMRTFFRVSFIPVEIEDDTCTQNPLLPVKVYGRKDIRQTLVNYPQ